VLQRDRLSWQYLDRKDAGLGMLQLKQAPPPEVIGVSACLATYRTCRDWDGDLIQCPDSPGPSYVRPDKLRNSALLTCLSLPAAAP
jgi:hypothetical protein